MTIEAEGIHHVSIYNALGQLVFDRAVDGDTLDFDFNGLGKGLYVVQIATTKEILKKTVTVM